MVIDDSGRQLREAVLRAGPAWSDLATLGLFGLALPEAVGGLGNPVADLAVAVEAAAELLAPGPVLPTLTAAIALARVPDHPLAAKLLPGIPTAIAARPLGDERFVPALMLGPIPNLNAPSSVILPPGSYARDRVFELFVHGIDRIQLTGLLDSGADFERVAFMPAGSGNVPI